MEPLDCGDLIVEDAGSLGVNVRSKNIDRQLCYFNAKGAAELQQWLAQRSLGKNEKSTEAALREASDLFHKILSALTAKRMVDREGAKMPQRFYDDIAARILSPEQIERLAADGFEACVRALVTLGAEDVTIHECNPTEEEHW